MRLPPRPFFHRLRSVACFTAVCLIATASTAVAQTFRFRAEATRVIVDVLVLDDDGDPVRGLTAADFELFEDDEAQRVASLDVVDWERYEVGEAVEGEAAAPDIEAAAAGNASPRRFVIVFNRRLADAVNLRRAKRGLEEFVTNNMVDGDETMVLELGASLRVLQEFSPGKEQTLANVRRIVPGNFDSVVGPEANARQVLQMLEAMGQALEPVDGRKIVVFLTADLQTVAESRQTVEVMEDFPARRAFDETNSLLATVRQLNHANATLYTVDLEGIYEHENNILSGTSPYVGSDNPLVRMAAAANLPGEGGAASLAVATGGTYYPNMTNFAVALNRIGVQNELYYLLSFSPLRTELDGEYRNIEVRVRDRPDLRVIARPGYFARERRGGVLEAAAHGDYGYAFPDNLHTYAYLLNPRPGGAFGVLAAAVPEEYVGEPAELQLRVTDTAGEILAEAEGTVNAQRFWISTPAALPVGEHQLEVVVERGGETVHSGSSLLTIAEELGATFSLSSVFPFVAEAHAEAMGPPPGTPGVGPPPPPPVRPVATFVRGEPARVAFLVYPGRERSASRVRVAYEVRNERDEMSLEAERPGVFELDPARPEGTPLMLMLDTAALRAGRYTAAVRVTDQQRDRTATGELSFLIR